MHMLDHSTESLKLAEHRAQLYRTGGEQGFAQQAWMQSPKRTGGEQGCPTSMAYQACPSTPRLYGYCYQRLLNNTRIEQLGKRK